MSKFGAHLLRCILGQLVARKANHDIFCRFLSVLQWKVHSSVWGRAEHSIRLFTVHLPPRPVVAALGFYRSSGETLAWPWRPPSFPPTPHSVASSGHERPRLRRHQDMKADLPPSPPPGRPASSELLLRLLDLEKKRGRRRICRRKKIECWEGEKHSSAR
jgi:hypothetical protein